MEKEDDSERSFRSFYGQMYTVGWSMVALANISNPGGGRMTSVRTSPLRSSLV